MADWSITVDVMGRVPGRWIVCAASCAAAILATPRDAGDAPTRVDSPRAVAAAALDARPIAFERNDGQTDPRAAFVARNAGAAVFVQKDGMTIQPRGVGRAPLRLAFDGGGASRVDGVERLPGHVNCLKGNDPSRWLRDVPLFARAVCRDAWPGVDVVFHGNGRDLEYDFEVAPGADPSAIALRFDDADAVAVDTAGDLVVRVGDETFKNLRPRAFQDGREIAGAFTSIGDGRVGFVVVGRDPSRPLVIDPVVAYATYVGGSDDETPYDATVDAAGDLYLVGAVVSLDFPVANALPSQAGGGSVDAFVTKLNASGAKFLYSTYLGGNGGDTAWGVRTDESGIYVAGSTTSPDFPVVHAYQSSMRGGVSEGDAFVTKLAPSGSDIVFSTFLGGAGDDGCRALAVDKDGACYVGGFTDSSDFPVTPGAARKTLSGLSDGWVAKISSTGSALAWSTYLGGSGDSEAVQGVAVDGAKNAFVCGFTESDDFPLGGPGGFRTSRPGGRIDGFLVRFDALGALTAGTFVGGAADENCRRVVVDAAGFPYVAGFTLSTDFPTLNAVQPNPSGGIGTGDGFVAEFKPTLASLVFSTYFGGTDDDDVQGLALGPDGSVFIAGNTTSTYFPLAGAVQSAYGGTRDAFAAKLAPAGASIVWSTYFGGPGYDAAKALAVDANGSAYVVISTQSADLPTFCAVQPSFGGGRDDAFVLKLTDDSSRLPGRPLNAVATSTSAYRVDFSWTDTSNNECYFRVERREEHGEYATVATPDANVTSYVDTDVEPDRTYVYRVTAVNPIGESAPSVESVVTTLSTVVVSPRSGALTESKRARGDAIRIMSLLRFNMYSADGEFRVPANAFEIRVGVSDDPVVIKIPADDPRWKRRRKSMTWTSPRRTRPVVRVDLSPDPLAPTLTVRVSRFDFPTTPDGTIFLELRCGKEAGHVERLWTPLKKRPGRFRLP
jgi:hypothetical protein